MLKNAVTEDELNTNNVILKMRYVPLSQAVLWDNDKGKNPKKHDIGSMIESIRLHGFRDAPIFDETAGCIIAGNGRTIALQKMKEAHSPVPRGILEKDGEWYLPIQFGVNAGSQEEAYAFGIDHNNLTLLGGDIGIEDVKRIWDEEDFSEMARMLASAGTQFASMDGDDLDYIINSGDDGITDENDSDDSADSNMVYNIIVECHSDTDMNNVTEILRSHGLKYKIVRKGSDLDDDDFDGELDDELDELDE